MLDVRLQVINAALALAAKPNSKVALDNMDLFKDQWEKQVHVLTDAVDDITSIDDFLCVSGKGPDPLEPEGIPQSPAGNSGLPVRPQNIMTLRLECTAQSFGRLCLRV